MQTQCSEVIEQCQGDAGKSVAVVMMIRKDLTVVGSLIVFWH